MIGGLLIAMWNYMGWDNASTIAQEVERPQRTYPRAMIVAVMVVALSYIVPVVAIWMTGLHPSQWETGSWAELGGIGRRPVAACRARTGRHDERVRHVQFAGDELLATAAGDGAGWDAAENIRQSGQRRRAPWVSILVCAIGWAMCLGLGFERLVTIDMLIYGSSLTLEFMALVVLRIREPKLPRTFRVPGGLFGAVGVAPMLLIGYAIVQRSTTSRSWE